MVPQLLAHLNIPHVALASHSGGDIYLLNTALAYPHLLHPETPYICFFAPWVHPSWTKVTHMQVTEWLPAPLIGKFATLAKFVTPLAELSGGLVHDIKGSLLRSKHAPAPIPLTPVAAHSRTPLINSCDDFSSLELDDPEVVVELKKHIVTFLFAESVHGISADAQLFLKKPRSISWSSPTMPWSDINDAVTLLSKIIDDEVQSNRNKRRWIIHAFHAEKDNMVGERGRRWFDDCWVSPQVSPAVDDTPTQPPIHYEYQSKIVPDTTHDYLMDPAFKASEKWFQQIRDSFPVEINA